MGAAEADGAHYARAQGEGEAVSFAVQKAKRAVAGFAIGAAVINQYGLEIEVGGEGQGHAMLGDVGGVLGGVEFDFYGLFVSTENKTVNDYLWIQK